MPCWVGGLGWVLFGGWDVGGGGGFLSCMWSFAQRRWRMFFLGCIARSCSWLLLLGLDAVAGFCFGRSFCHDDDCCSASIVASLCHASAPGAAQAIRIYIQMLIACCPQKKKSSPCCQILNPPSFSAIPLQMYIPSRSVMSKKCDGFLVSDEPLGGMSVRCQITLYEGDMLRFWCES